MFHLPSSTLRYYEDLGILTNVGRSKSGQRGYIQGQINRLKTICCFKKTGMSIAKLQQFLACEEDESAHIDEILSLLIVLLLADLLVPLQIKFGAEKSKIVILATVGILVLGFEIMKNLDQYMQGISSWGRNLWQIISSYKILFGIAGILLVALLTFISWTISCRVLEKQEM